MDTPIHLHTDQEKKKIEAEKYDKQTKENNRKSVTYVWQVQTTNMALHVCTIRHIEKKGTK